MLWDTPVRFGHSEKKWVLLMRALTIGQVEQRGENAVARAAEVSYLDIHRVTLLHSMLFCESVQSGRTSELRQGK